MLCSSDLPFAQTISALAYTNPFLPLRTDLERKALGREFDERFAQWNVIGDTSSEQPNLARLVARTEEVLARARRIDPAGDRSTPPPHHEIALHEDLAWFASYHRLRDEFAAAALADPQKFDFHRRLYEPLRTQVTSYFADERQAAPCLAQLPHLAALFCQLGRAFHYIFHFLLGASRPAVELRAAVWQSIFTHDMRRYRRVLFDRMGDYATLITGPSGTGKELVARAVGLSRYVPFDPSTGRPADVGTETFLPLNLSALSPTLIESELFGHRRGAFTGAGEHRIGRLESCSPLGAVFLDEIGELSPEIQVKLLRVIQDRTFQRLGENEPRSFRGKLISATNRDLTHEMRSGKFREDLYYRLCSDQIVTPSLRARLDDNPADLRMLVVREVARMVEDEAEQVTDEVLETIDRRLGPNYAWPGNVRELQQCVRNVLIRRDYTPPAYRADTPHSDPPHFTASTSTAATAAAAVKVVDDPLSAAFRTGTLTAEQLVGRYCAAVYARTGSYEATAEVVKLDRRTVKAKIEAASRSEVPLAVPVL
jgi:DNA-binding NtrC family response regulator